MTEFVFDESSGSASARVACTGFALQWTAAHLEWALDPDDPVLPLPGHGVDPATGALLYIHTGAGSAIVPSSWHDQGGRSKYGTREDFPLRLTSRGVFASRRQAIA